MAKKIKPETLREIARQAFNRGLQLAPAENAQHAAELWEGSANRILGKFHVVVPPVVPSLISLPARAFCNAMGLPGSFNLDPKTTIKVLENGKTIVEGGRLKPTLLTGMGDFDRHHIREVAEILSRAGLRPCPPPAMAPLPLSVVSNKTEDEHHAPSED